VLGAGAASVSAHRVSTLGDRLLLRREEITELGDDLYVRYRRRS
jgi:riboflavin biosynthesis pyrimidine reductase